MLKPLSVGLLSVSLGGLWGCAVDAPTAFEEDQASAEQEVLSCNNANRVMYMRLADFATAWANEMGQLNATEQFQTVVIEGVTQLALSDYGTAICAARGGCPWVNTFLALQTLSANPKWGNDVLDIATYRNWLVTYFGWAKANVSARVANGYWTQLPEDNSVTLLGVDGTAKCGTPWYSFDVRRDFHLTFSTEGPVAGQFCLPIHDPIDPHGWVNNHLCMPRDYGFRWSSAGPIAGMYCTLFAEPWDPDGWGDDYLCTPENFGLTYSYAGPIAGKKCLLTNEPNDPWGWWDNYLCWDSTAPLNHPSTLCESFAMFGGAAKCGGDNPYLDFTVTSATKFKVDPTDYTQGTINTTTTGQCFISFPLVATTNVSNSCCYQNGRFGYVVKYTTRPNTYYCRTS